MRAPKLTIVRRGFAAWLAPLVVLTLGGCLLPQPDTPPIGPPGASGRVAAPDTKRPTTDTALASPAPAATEPMATTLPAASATAGVTSGAAGMMPDSAPGRLEGRITGATATRVSAVPEAAGQPGALVTPEVDGRFTLALAPGRYTLELTIAGGVVIATPVVEVKAGEPTRVEVTVAADGKAAGVAPEP